MKYKLIKEINPNYSALEQVLTNRGIEYNNLYHYINTTDADINSPLAFGEENMKNAAASIITAVKYNLKALIIVDSDCDGFTSAALLINYLYTLFPAWTKHYLTWYIHEGKQHGLNDCYEQAYTDDFKLVILPDAGSNDVEFHQKLYENGITTVCLDHHIVDAEITCGIVINNQNSDYPNKELSGVGVTWQLCRYLDTLLNTDYANQYLDLVALGNTADMQSLQSIETKHLINKGFEPENIHNPFIYYMWQKNQFKLGDHITSWGAAFYIAPLVNAIVRSGTQEEKELIFESMLAFKAFNLIPSTKRGHLPGEQEKLVEQAVRTCTNVKNRQSRAQDAGMELLENKIIEDNMLEHKVLLFLLEPGQIDKNIAGLCANKVASLYQRPCAILTRVEEISKVEFPNNDKVIAEMYTNISYQGSARGCDIVGITNFKSICAGTGLTSLAAGHEGAFGLNIPEENINKFISATDEALKDMPSEALYYVDYIYNGNNVNPQNILDIASMDCYWGKDLSESIVAIENLTIVPEMVTIYNKSSITIKIQLNNNVTLMLFNATEKDCDKLQTNNTGYVKINCVGKCHLNEWNGNVSPQIFITEYEIVDSSKYFF
jgi:single-stranded-DNA-specific exonuclease